VEIDTDLNIQNEKEAEQSIKTRHYAEGTNDSLDA